MTSRASIARTIATGPDGNVQTHVMFEHGTVLFLSEPNEEKALRAAEAIDKAIGPYGGEGGAPGDFNPMKLKAFDGWLVEFCWGSGVVTIVLREDMDGPPVKPFPTEVVQGISDRESLAAGLRGRAARNRDMRERKIVHRSWETT